MVPIEAQPPNEPPLHFLLVDGVYYPCLRFGYDVVMPTFASGNPVASCCITAWMLSPEGFLTHLMAESILILAPIAPSCPAYIYDLQKVRVQNRVLVPALAPPSLRSVGSVSPSHPG